MKLVTEHNVQDALIWLMRRQPLQDGANGKNLFMEWDDNSIGYGGTSVINKLFQDSNGRWSIVRGQQGGSLTVDRFIYGFIDKKTNNEINRDRTESSGLAEMGGSISVYNYSYYDMIGFVTPERKFMIAMFNYDIPNVNVATDGISTSQFKTINGLNVKIFEVTKDEYIKEHGLGKSYNGWFNKSFLFNSTRLKPDYHGLVDFSSERYQFKTSKKLRYELHTEGEESLSLPTKQFLFPCNSGKHITHYNQMFQVETFEEGETLHTLECGEDIYEGTLFSYETIRASQTDKIIALEEMAGSVQNIHPTHYKKLDFPTIDVIDASGTYITTVELFPKATRWDEFYNNRKWFFVLSPDSEVPFSAFKARFSNDSFPTKLRKHIKDIAQYHDLGHTGSSKMKKKIEDQEVATYISILKDDTNPSHAVTLLNTEKLVGSKIDLVDITTECTTYAFNTDIIFNPNHSHLVEWQKDMMDDEHITEFTARMVMPRHKFKTLTWVHGGESTNLVDKLKSIVDGGRINLDGIDKIQVIHKTNLYTTKGWEKAITIYSNK
jgi:hypothetical protein